MALKVLTSSESRHYVVAVFRPEMDTGIAFDLRCQRCRRHFGGFKMDETIAGTIPMYSVVNMCHTKINKAQDDFQNEVCVP